MEKKEDNSKKSKAEINKKTKEIVKKSNKTRKIIVLFVIVLFAIITGISLRAEYLNYLEIGEEYISVLYQKIKNKYIVIGVAFAITYVCVCVNICIYICFK